MSTQAQLQWAATASPTCLHTPGHGRIAIGSAPVDTCSFDEAVSGIIKHALVRGAPAQVITPNAQHIVLLNRDRRLREIYNSAELIVPDGISLVLAARVLRQKFPGRVAGVDLLKAICARAAAANLKVFLLGGRPGSAEATAARLKQHSPPLEIETYCPPFGFESDITELSRIAARIRSAQPDLIFVGLGAPKQEYWIHEHGRQLDVRVCIGVGASFEIIAGIEKRAPLWLQRIGCEWLYRLFKDPRNKWRRYLLGNLAFLWIVVRQRFHQLKTESREHRDTGRR